MSELERLQAEVERLKAESRMKLADAGLLLYTERQARDDAEREVARLTAELASERESHAATQACCDNNAQAAISLNARLSAAERERDVWKDKATWLGKVCPAAEQRAVSARAALAGEQANG